MTIPPQRPCMSEPAAMTINQPAQNAPPTKISNPGKKLKEDGQKKKEKSKSRGNKQENQRKGGDP